MIADERKWRVPCSHVVFVFVMGGRDKIVLSINEELITELDILWHPCLKRSYRMRSLWMHIYRKRVFGWTRRICHQPVTKPPRTLYLAA